MNQQYTKYEIMNKILHSIQNKQWEEESIQPQMLSFFQDSSIETFNKIMVMCAMSNQNLKFPQLEDVDSNNLQELHLRLMDLFGTNEDNVLSMVHIFACIVNSKSIDVIESLIDISTILGESVVMERMNEHGATILHLSCKYNATIDLINKLISIGGKDFVMITNNVGETALHTACSVNASIDIINKLVDIGGRDLVMATDNNEGTVLIAACYKNASIDVINKLIDVGGRDLAMSTDDFGETALHYACNNSNQSIKIINKLIDVGGRDLVMSTGNDGETALHLACSDNAPINIINKLIDVGGRDLVMMTGTSGETALHEACCSNPSNDVVNKLVDVGGRDLVMIASGYHGSTALHWACHWNLSMDIINKLIDVGGRDLVMITDNNGCTALHGACASYKPSINVIIKLIHVGGRDIVLVSNGDGRTALHNVCSRNVSIEVVNKLIDIGGKEVLTTYDNDGKSPLVALLSAPCDIDGKSAKTSSIISKATQFQVAGEFGFGGLFDSAFDDEIKDIIYKQWNETIIPALEEDDMVLINGQSILLHAAIIAKAPAHIIRDIISRFDCILSEDSMGRCPIDVAVVEGLKWHEGMDDVVREYTTSTAEQQGQQERLVINVAALHGLLWESGMQQALEESIVQVGNNNVDAMTGLFPFMLAAVGKSSDLRTIYELMRRSPHNVKLFKSSRKRKGNHDIDDIMIQQKYRKDE
jgi:ankyrin repeat protein